MKTPVLPSLIIAVPPSAEVIIILNLVFLILMHFLILKYRDAHVPKQITFSKFKKKSKVRKKINKTQ